MMNYMAAPGVVPEKKLINIILDYFNISEEQLIERNRNRNVVLARTVYSIFCVRKLKMKTVEVGRMLGLDHSSIVHMNKKYNSLNSDRVLSQAYLDVCLKMGNVNSLSAYLFDIKHEYFVKETEHNFCFRYPVEKGGSLNIDKRYCDIETHVDENQTKWARLIISPCYAYELNIINLRRRIGSDYSRIAGERLSTGDIYLYPTRKIITNNFLFKKLELDNN